MRVTTNTFLALGVFAASLGVYLLTLTPSVAFWDSGEYIAASHILGVPHSPGTPLYILLGRLASLVPLGTVAQRVNAFSALAAALTVMLMYLVTVRATRLAFPPTPAFPFRWKPQVAGVVTALMLAFSTTFWTNAIEAEVYAGACAMMALGVWILFRWHDTAKDPRLILVVTYLVGLGAGMHLGVAVIAWAAVPFVFLVRPAYIKDAGMLGWALVTLSLGFGVTRLGLSIAPVVFLGALAVFAFTGRLNKMAFWSGLVFLAGLSLHAFLLIRANQDPAINETAPKDLHALWLTLIRDQFKPGSPLDRRADLAFQFGDMYWRYLEWNFTLLTIKSRELFHVPMVLTLVGAVAHARKHFKSWVIFAALFVFLGPAMVVYLNFGEGEPRERDYFFVQNIQFLLPWLGLGCITVMEFFSPRSRRASWILAIVFLGMACLPLVNNFKSHDRRGFDLPREYASNMLVGLEPNALLLTYGDNDTFPLWYIQQVEGMRPDVRVINHSLLNTIWYMEQLRDQQGVPITWTDQEMRSLVPYLDRGGNIVPVSDQAFRHLVNNNNFADPLYIAVTVPLTFGLDQNMSLEGIVYRVHSQPVESPVNIQKASENLNRVYTLTPNAASAEEMRIEGKANAKVDNGMELLQNYATSFSRLAYAMYEAGNSEQALEQLDRAYEILTVFPGLALLRGILLEDLGRWDEVLEHYQASVEIYPGEWEYRHRAGLVYVRRGQYQKAAQFFEEARALAPGEYKPYQGLLTSYYNMGDYQSALEIMRQWSAFSPGDANVRELIQKLERSVETGEDPFPPDTTGS